jgi:crotonobetainyl-CoA:carnitine CoA-transferase CaiB-like acyl-CoA transferase
MEDCRLIDQSSALPMSGLTVVEFGTSVAAPTAGQILAELGAEVIKIENPKGGDDARSWGPPFIDGTAGVFVAINRNKKSAAVDLKNADHRAAVRRFIVDRADIVLQNLRAGVVESYALDGASLTTEKPSLIYFNLSAFGTAGPLAGKPGYDPLMQAFGGLMTVTGEDGRPPVRVGPALIDQGAALWMVIGVLAALRKRDVSGAGGVIDGSLYETALWWMNTHTANHMISGRVPQRIGSENVSLVPYKAYEAKDGWIVIAAGNNEQFARLAKALGRPEWIDDPAYKLNADRVQNRLQLNALIDDIVHTATREHWLGVLDKIGVPCAPMLGLDEVLAHPQCKAVEMVQADPAGGPALIGVPLKFGGQRPPYRNSAPKLGDATHVILQNLAVAE